MYKKFISIIFIFIYAFSTNLAYAAGEPTVTASHSSVSYTSATLELDVTNPGSSTPTDVGFEWGLTSSYGSSSTEDYELHNTTYVSKFGSSGTGNGQFNVAFGVAIDQSGNIYVSDQDNQRVQKFDSSGNYVLQFGSQGSGNGQFAADSTRDLAVDSSGNIFVLDSTLNRVQKFNSSGTYVSQFGSTGSGNGQFTLAYVIAIDSSDNIYVGDYSAKRVQKFNSSGVYQMQFGTSGTGNGQFQNITGITVDSSGNIYVSDSSLDRVQKFNSSGTYVSQFGSSAAGNNQLIDNYGLDTDDDGNIYVVEYGGYRVKKFDSSGNYITQFGSSGTGNGQFNRPVGIEIYDGHAYISEYSGNRVQKFAIGQQTEYTESLTGLIPGTTYHYRVFATNSNGTTYSDDATFTTSNFTVVPSTPGSAPDLASASDTGTITTDNYTNDTTPTFTGSCSYNETVKIYVDGNLVTPSSTCSNDVFSITLNNTLEFGSHTIKYALSNNIGDSGYSPELSIYIYYGDYACCNISGLTKPHGPNPVYNGKLYVTQYTTNNVAVIDLATNTVIETLESADPVYINFRFGEKMYIINNNGYYNPGSVTIYDLNDTSAPLKTLTLGNDTVWMQDAGEYFYIFNRHAFNGPATVSVIDKNTDTVATTITVGNGANRGTLGPNGKFYVSNHHDSTVSIVDVASSTVVGTLDVDISYEDYGPSDSLLVGTKIYVANWDAATIGVIDTETDTLLATIPINGDVASAMGYHNGLLYVNPRHSRNVTVIDTDTDTVVNTFEIIAGGYSMKVHNDMIYFVNQDSEFISVYNPTTQQIIKNIIVGNGPHSINAYNNCLYVNNFNTGSISTIDSTTNTPSSDCGRSSSVSSANGTVPLYILQAMSDAIHKQENIKNNQSVSVEKENNPTTDNSSNTILSPIDNKTKLSCPAFNKYLKFGDRNPEVRLWQVFLNKNLNKKIPITGYFGPITLNAVKEYQLKNSDQILKPWGLSVPTGRIYQTTRYYANLDMGCKENSLKLDNGALINN